jgi:ABC transporter substrate binding protein
VSTLSRPGGNLTSTSFMSIDVVPKRVQLVKELVPKLSRLAVLGNPAHPSYASQIRVIEAGARSLGVQVESIGVRGPNDFQAGFRAVRWAQALIQLDDVMLSTHRRSLVELPSPTNCRSCTDFGSTLRRAASYRMARTSGTCTAERPSSWTEFSTVIFRNHSPSP